MHTHYYNDTRPLSRRKGRNHQEGAYSGCGVGVLINSLLKLASGASETGTAEVIADIACN